MLVNLFFCNVCLLCSKHSNWCNYTGLFKRTLSCDSLLGLAFPYKVHLAVFRVTINTGGRPNNGSNVGFYFTFLCSDSFY
jgi:hypothetical protein